MTARTPKIERAPMDWVLVANAARARCFERDAENQALRELAGFVHPQSRLKGDALGDQPGGKAMKSGASTQFQAHTDVHVKTHAQFARELAQYMEEAALAHRMPGWVMLASDPFLGELRSHLGDAARRLLRSSHSLDLTSYVGAELEHRVTQALGGVVAS